MGWGQVKKLFWDLPMKTINFGFGSTALTFCFKFGYMRGLFCAFSGLLGLSFWPFGVIFWVKVWFKNIFGNYLCRQSTLVLEIQPSLFVFISAKFWAFFALFWLFGAIFRVQKLFGTCLHRLTTFTLEV